MPSDQLGADQLGADQLGANRLDADHLGTDHLGADQLGIVLVTAASQTEAESIAQALLTANLAACVSLWPVRSIYSWQGKLENSQEWQLLIKTDLAQFDRLEANVRSLHSYDVPEIIALPIAAGSTAYLNWLRAETTP